MSYQVRRKTQYTEPVAFDVPKKFMSMDNVLVTPAIAQFLLDNHNKLNRPVKDTRVDQYVLEMLLNRWRNDNGERMIFDAEGNMISGQHRCIAVVKSGVSIRVDMKFGVAVEARDSVDNGAVRSTADIRMLQTHNPDSPFIVKTINGVKKIINRRRTPTSPVLVELLENELTRGIRVALLNKSKSGLGRGPAAGAVTLAAEAYPVKVRALIEELVDLNGKTSTVAASALKQYVWERIAGEKEDVVSSKILYGIWAHLEGKDISYLKTTHHEETVKYFVDRIRNDHAIPTIDLVAKEAVAA